MHVLLVLDHPYTLSSADNVPHDRSFTAAMAKAAITGLTSAGHSVDVADLHAESFDPVMRREDLTSWRQRSVVDAQVASYHERLARADHLVFVFPLWWEAMPAMTKGFLDKVLTKGIVYDEPKPRRPFRSKLPNLEAVSVLTVMSTPSWIYRWIFGNPLPKIIFRGTFRKMGINHLRWTSIADISTKSAEHREDLLAALTRRFAAL